MIYKPSIVSKVIVGRLVIKPSARFSSTGTKVITAGEYAVQPKAKKPWSPHVTIYAFPFPAITSIAHRITGVALAGNKITYFF